MNTGARIIDTITKLCTFAAIFLIQGLSVIKSIIVPYRTIKPPAQNPEPSLVGVILSTKAGRFSANISHVPTFGPFK